MTSAARNRLIPVLLLLVITVAIWWTRRRPPQTYPTAYVNDRSAVVWSTTAQVRQRVATLNYGQRVSVLGHTNDQVEIRSDDGVHGWVDAQLLMPPELWQRAADLLAHARTLPVQASGHTRAQSNVHMDASRPALRIFQFGRNTPVVVLERKTTAAPVPAAAAVPAPTAPPSAAPASSTPDDDASDSAPAEPKQEDWLLVLHDPAQNHAPAAPPANPGGSPASGALNTVEGADVPIAGWVLARFIDLDPPATVADNASSAGLRVVAWAVLNTVTDAGATHPQYLVAGARGGEGQPCDFTSLRVFTWGEARQRYETAYVENNLCGRFPMRTATMPDGAEFRFPELDENNVERVYRMKQTIVRRVRQNPPVPSRGR